MPLVKVVTVVEHAGGINKEGVGYSEGVGGRHSVIRMRKRLLDQLGPAGGSRDFSGSFSTSTS